ncbi:hypothetical protein HMJ29_00045 [Hymenobacter taeanensis]|uniref:UPF0323 domain-containing protein n=1 Tax=Hymenobacter taeanensis TaxID=2735321 RepID=A0A6M6BBM7_9BACT|nr:MULTISPECIES: hypothetical protein [Hymenobacter]QJX45409.1 hypothetical protein HMJ29_00045 [Hymenobacter taeanensis]UOQ81348.1 hypothetical protein MUN83_00665 [Hymenobacter sp. 5414T-23]
MNKSYFQLGDWRRNVLLISAAASLGLGLPACTSGSDSDATAEDWGSGDSYSEGVITEMTEVKPGEWKITAEQPAGKEQVAAVLKHFDGRVDTLQGQALQQQMQNYSRQYPENRVGGTGMMDVLMWSGLGYMAGRFLTPQSAYYANPGIVGQNMGWRSRVAEERGQGRSFFGRGFAGSRTSSAGSGIRPSTTVTRSTGYGRSSIRNSAPRSGRSSGFGSRGFGGRGFGG